MLRHPSRAPLAGLLERVGARNPVVAGQAALLNLAGYSWSGVPCVSRGRFG